MSTTIETETFTVPFRKTTRTITLPKKSFLEDYADARAAAVIRCETESPSDTQVHDHLVKHPKYATLTLEDVRGRLSAEAKAVVPDAPVPVVTESPKRAEAIRLFSSLEAVEEINRWTTPDGRITRYYLVLRSASDRFRGDGSLKLWIDSRGTLIHEPHKGTLSDGCRSDRDAVLEFAAANGIKIQVK